MQYIDTYSSPLGGITMASDGESLTGLWFDGQKYFGATLTDSREEKHLPVFQQAKKWLDLYFQGKKPPFTPPLSPQGSPFRQRVWEILLQISYGQTMTYGEIASRIAVLEAGIKNSPSEVCTKPYPAPDIFRTPCGKMRGVRRAELFLVRERDIASLHRSNGI